MYCPVCKVELKEDMTNCYICGTDVNEDNDTEWIMLGAIEDKISADFAKETLQSYNIPVVIISKSGFFGNSGLPLGTFFKDGVGLFEVMIPNMYKEETDEILKTIIGEKWQRKDSD